MTNYSNTDCIASLATARIPSALSIIRCSGAGTIAKIATVFSRPQALHKANSHTIIYGFIVNGKTKIDEVLLSVFLAPHSFTGEEMVEISLHGSLPVIDSVLSLLFSAGFRQAAPGEYTLRAFVNGKIDLTKAEAVNELILSKTQIAALHAIERLTGSLKDKITQIKDEIIDILSILTVQAEYPEDENAVPATFNSEPILRLQRELSILYSTWHATNLYQQTSRVVLCGKVNAGKSSCFNAIIKQERSIVSSVPGTTRDYIEAICDFQGLPVSLFDTAGFREDTLDQIEKEGISRTKDIIENSDLILYIIDSTKAIDKEEEKQIRSFSSPVLLVFNKCDIALMPSNCILESLKDIAYVSISAKKEIGLDNLFSASAAILKKNIPNIDSTQALGTLRQKVCIQNALKSINHAIDAIKEYTPDMVAFDIEECLHCIEEITGEVTTNDILDSIFSSFCVGK